MLIFCSVFCIFCALEEFCWLIKVSSLVDYTLFLCHYRWVHWYTLACILNAYKKSVLAFSSNYHWLGSFPCNFTRVTAAFKIYCNWIERAQDICSHSRWVSVDPKMKMKTKCNELEKVVLLIDMINKSSVRDGSAELFWSWLFCY